MKRFFASIVTILLAVSWGVAQNPDAFIKEQLEKYKSEKSAQQGEGATTQGISDQQVQEFLNQGGVSEKMIENEIKQQGVNLTQEDLGIGDTKKDDVIEKKIDEVVEKAVDNAQKKVVKDASAETLENVQQAIKSGATLEEALAETAIDNLNQELKNSTIWGQQIFRDKSLQLYRLSKDVRPPDSYVLGVGDELAISIFGEAEFNGIFRINDDGYIKVFKIPRIYLKGISYGEARKLIEAQFGLYYNLNTSRIVMALNFSRNIRVNIVGEVFNFGTFAIPAVNSAFNAMIASGGPTDIGSVRRIKLKSEGKKDRIMDVYKYLLDPSTINQFYLEDGDYIFVPTAEKIVTFTGAVRRPYRYELNESENLMELVSWAGGINHDALLENLRIQRYQDGKKIIIDVNYKDLLERKSNFALQDGDIVEVLYVPGDALNYVSTNGAIYAPGQYAYNPGMRVKDVLKKAKVREEARLDIAYVVRTSEDKSTRAIEINLKEILDNPDSYAGNIKLERFDRIEVFYQSKFSTKGFVSATGHLREEIKTQFFPGITLRELVTLSGGVLQDYAKFGYVRRLSDELTPAYIRVDIDRMIKDSTFTKSFLLQENDQLIVYSKNAFKDNYKVQLSGAVRRPSDLDYDKSLTLEDAIYLCGGLTKEAANSRIEISRILQDTATQKTRVVIASVKVDKNLNLESDKGFPLQPYDQVFIRVAPEFELQQNIQIEGEVVFPGPYTLLDKNERVASVIQRAGGLATGAFPAGATLFREDNNTGFILIDLAEVLKNPDSKFNYVLKAGDVIRIPKQNTLVSITGEVRFPRIDEIERINVPHHQGKRAYFYIKKYGLGLTQNARKRFIHVTYPNGYIKETRQIFWVNIYPKVEEGCVVHAGAKTVRTREDRERSSFDWERVLSTTLTQATAVLTFILLIDRSFQ